jgi:hypothetical protein
MSHSNYPLRVVQDVTLACALALLGCDGAQSRLYEPGSEPVPQADPTKPPVKKPAVSAQAERKAAEPVGDNKKVLDPTTKAVWLETRGKRRRVLVEASVCLREGQYGLECLLCRKHTKEHESILVTEADARVIHAGLLVANAEPGKPVEYDEKARQIIPPKGSKIRVSLQFEEGKGKEKKVKVVPAGDWILNDKNGKALDMDWVFAGSKLYQNPDSDNKDPIYAANTDGAYICVTDVPTAMLALPITSSNNPETREFKPFTKRIPEEKTKVMIILEPVVETKKK